VLEITMLGGFRSFADGREIAAPASSARVVAFLALARGRCAEREVIAETLWPETDSPRALANLRSSLWRMPPPLRRSIRRIGHRIELDRDVTVDTDALECPGVYSAPIDALSEPLLPSWYDDWVLLERERLDLRRVAALEAIAVQRLDDGAFAECLDVALLAIGVDPYRESLHRIVIRAHLAEGNDSEARRHYSRLERLLESSIGAAPSPETAGLIARLDRDHPA
jgi:DNA-binding SARP family transcriptional activator